MREEWWLGAESAQFHHYLLSKYHVFLWFSSVTRSNYRELLITVTGNFTGNF